MSDPARPHWVFGLALVPAAGALWLAAAPGSGILELASSFVIAYLASLLLAAAVAGAALAAWECLAEMRDAMLDLLGFRRSRP